ncbi:MAG: hypothetical protein V4631_08030 [Pseudomonadota bacterium]
MRLLRIVLFSGAVLAGGLVVYFNREPAALAPEKIAVQGSPVASPATEKIVATAQPGPVKAPSDDMRKNFEEARDYAAFIHDAMQRPTEGGRFYAYLAHNRCSEILTVTSNPDAKVVGNPQLRENAEKAVEDLKKRCSGVKAFFPNDLVFIKALLHSNAKGRPDTLLDERGGLSSASKKFYAADIARAIASRDPYLLALTVENNADYLAPKIDPAYADGQNRPVLYAAAGAAACEIVGNCKDGLLVLTPCLVGGLCAHTDYRDMLRDDIEPASRELFDKTKRALLVFVGRK